MKGADVGLKWVLMFPIAGSCRGEEGHREGPHYPQRALSSLGSNWLAWVHALPGCFLLGQEPDTLEDTTLLFIGTGIYLCFSCATITTYLRQKKLLIWVFIWFTLQQWCGVYHNWDENCQTVLIGCLDLCWTYLQPGDKLGGFSKKYCPLVVFI